MAPPPDETTALLAKPPEATSRRSCFPPLYRVYLTSMIVGMSFSFTQTALIYSFRTMTCDKYYKTHDWSGVGDRCAIHQIESVTARSVALMSSITTACTVVNLFTSAWFIQRFGVKAAMFQQTFWAALRNLTQIYAQTVGGAAGKTIITTTQVFNMLGSAGGFQLCANSFVAVLSSDSARTANFGVLGGLFTIGSGVGYTLGGVSERLLGYLAPFQCAFVLLCSSTVFGILFLPHFTPEHTDERRQRKGFLAPLKVFIPRPRGTGAGRDWNLTLLGVGTFFSVLATGYVPMMLQLVGTNVFGFKPDTAGYMLSLNLLMRGFFLTQCFPVIIRLGRQWLAAPTEVSPSVSPGSEGGQEVPSPKSRKTPISSRSSSQSPDRAAKPRRNSMRAAGLPTPPIPNIPRRRSSASRGSVSAASARSSLAPPLQPAPEHPFDADGAEIPDATGEPVVDLAPPTTDAAHGSLFDLGFLRYSILLDGILTSAVTFATAPWHMYLAAGVLPFASGTGPASKGVTLEFVEPDQRPDALSAIALIEKLAQVSTIGLFGYTLSLLSEAGLPTLVFAANGAVALLGFTMLMFVHLPRKALEGSV